MKNYSYYILSLVLTLLVRLTVVGQTTLVSTQAQFNAALDNNPQNDSIIWLSGTYQDIYMDIDKGDVVITCQELGKTIFTGASRVNVDADNVTLRGFQFVDGDIGTNHVIETRGDNNVFEHLNIQGYISYKYLIVDEESQYNTIAYCNFEDRKNLDDQNILSILVHDTRPGYHVIQYCSFKNFDGTGNDLGIEPIRIGVSTQAEFISRSTVEYCYFTKCDGDGELISSKATQNVYRYNTFENNPLAELVLRHGSQNLVYGNFFVNGMGGVRIREGQDHVIFNNYFSELTRRSIFVQNGGNDPVGNITIAYNTIVDSEEIRLSESGDDKPTNITFANNIFSDPVESLFDDATGNETWLGNMYSGSLGITSTTGLTSTNLELELNSEGYYGLTQNSPAINASVSGFPALPEYEGLDTDNDISFDLMRQPRPADISSKDVGCSEYPHDVVIQPVATEKNTGPSYLFEEEEEEEEEEENQQNLKINIEGDGTVTLNPPSGLYAVGTTVTITAVPENDAEFVDWGGDLSGTTNPQTLVMDSDKEITATFFTMVEEVVTSVEPMMSIEGIHLFPNPVADQLNLTIENDNLVWVKVDLLSASGKKIHTLVKESIPNSGLTINQDISDLQAGIYILRLSYLGKDKSIQSEHTMKIIKE